MVKVPNKTHCYALYLPDSITKSGQWKMQAVMLSVYHFVFLSQVLLYEEIY